MLDGKADPSLLDTYNDERIPIGRQIVERANQSIEEFGGISDAPGFTDTADSEHLLANMAALRKAPPKRPRGADAACGTGAEELRIQRPRC